MAEITSAATPAAHEAAAAVGDSFPEGPPGRFLEACAGVLASWIAFAFASGKDPFALYNDPKAYAALMDDVGKKLTACKGNVKFYWDNKDQLLNGARTGEIVGAMMWDTGGWKLNSENPEIQYIAPKSGALGWIDTFAIPAHR